LKAFTLTQEKILAIENQEVRPIEDIMNELMLLRRGYKRFLKSNPRKPKITVTQAIQTH